MTYSDIQMENDRNSAIHVQHESVNVQYGERCETMCIRVHEAMLSDTDNP